MRVVTLRPLPFLGIGLMLCVLLCRTVTGIEPLVEDDSGDPDAAPALTALPSQTNGSLPDDAVADVTSEDPIIGSTTDDPMMLDLYDPANLTAGTLQVQAGSNCGGGSCENDLVCPNRCSCGPSAYCWKSIIGSSCYC